MLYNSLCLEVSRFASKNTHKPEMSGVFFKPDRVVASDTFRLLEITAPSEVKPEDFPMLPDKKSAMRGCKPFIIPASAVKDIAKMKRGGENARTLPILNYVAISRVDESQVEFISNYNLETGDSKFVRRVEGTFPDYEQMFSQGEPVAEVSINGKLLSELLDTMSKFNKSQSVKIKFYGGQKPIVLLTENETQKARGLFMPQKEI